MHVKLGFLLVVVVLIVWHLRRPQTHAVEGGIFFGSLAIAWLGASLAH